MIDCVIKYLESKLFRVRDITDNTSIPKSTVNYYLNNPDKVRKANDYNISQLYNYFKSLNLDDNNLNEYKRVTKVQFVKE